MTTVKRYVSRSGHDLWVPIDATDTEVAEASNGCGPSGWRVDLVPDNLLGVDIASACDIHDWMYEEGEDRQEADEVFLKNMLELVNAKGGWLRCFRRMLARFYYRVVAKSGAEYFRVKI